MAEKRRASRSPMTLDDVNRHASRYDIHNNTSKRINYFNSILKKKGLLSEGTKKSVYEALGDLYSRDNGGMDEAIDCYEKAGSWKKYGQIVQHMNRQDPKKYTLDSAAEALMKGGDFFHASLLYEHQLKDPLKAAKAYHAAGMNNKEKEMLREYAHELLDGGKYHEAAKYFEEAKNPSGLKAVAKQVTGEERTRLLEKAERIYAQKEKADTEKRGIVGKKSLLEKMLDKIHFSKVMGALGIFGGAYLMSPTITGNAISDMGIKASGIIGICAFCLGITVLYLHFKRI